MIYKVLALFSLVSLSVQGSNVPLKKENLHKNMDLFEKITTKCQEIDQLIEKYENELRKIEKKKLKQSQD